MEEGRVPLAPIAEMESRRMTVCRTLLAISVLADACLAPVAMWSPFGFNVDVWWKDQVAAWSLDASVADWLMIAWLRDVLMAVLLFSMAACRRQANALEDAPWCRRVVVAREPAFVDVAGSCRIRVILLIFVVFCKLPRSTVESIPFPPRGRQGPKASLEIKMNDYAELGDVRNAELSYERLR
eukprot:symbB.v1.2.025382.t1/scaffold2458.1/size78746/1